MEDRRGALLAFYRERRRMPTVSEMMRAFGLASRASAFYVSGKLVERGIVEKDSSGKLVPGPALFAVQRVGRVRAGFAAPAEEELADTVSIGEYLVRDPQASYLLEVVGDSMEDAGIRAGDMVVFERTKDCKPGDIVVALTEDGYTLKYLRMRRGAYYLEAANDRYPDIHPKEGEIIGKAVATFRTYG